MTAAHEGEEMRVQRAQASVVFEREHDAHEDRDDVRLRSPIEVPPRLDRDKWSDRQCRRCNGAGLICAVRSAGVHGAEKRHYVVVAGRGVQRCPFCWGSGADVAGEVVLDVMFGYVNAKENAGVRRELFAPITEDSAVATPAFLREHTVGVWRSIELIVQYQRVGIDAATWAIAEMRHIQREIERAL